MCPWRAGCGGSRKSGSAEGGEETTGRKAGTRRLAADPARVPRQGARTRAVGPYDARPGAAADGLSTWAKRAGEADVEAQRRLRAGETVSGATNGALAWAGEAAHDAGRRTRRHSRES